MIIPSKFKLSAIDQPIFDERLAWRPHLRWITCGIILTRPESSPYRIVIRRSASRSPVFTDLIRTHLNINEGPHDFMARLGITEKFGQLTRTDDASIWINKSSVLSVRSRIWSDTPMANSVVVISSITPITQ